MNRQFPLAILSSNVTTLREARGMNQTQLSKKAEVSQKVISNLERANELRIHPTVETLSRVAEALGVPTFILLMPLPRDQLLNVMQDKVSRLIDNYVHASHEGQAAMDRMGELESRAQH